MNHKILSYKLQFIGSPRFLSSLLSNLVNNVAEGIHKVKCKHGHDNKKNAKSVELNTRIETAFSNTQILEIVQQNTNNYVITRVTKKQFDESLKR